MSKGGRDVPCLPQKRGTTSEFQPWQWQFQRQTSFGYSRGFLHSKHSDILPSLYSNIKCTMSWDPQKTTDHTHHKGIFNFDFSPDGKLLVAACEGGSVLTFDPLNASLINHKNKAHSDCVNCVRFLDTRLFATCSDDTTVALWDARFMKTRVRTLSGHLSWVKNIEYASNLGLLVTSGFDGCVYTWDIDNYSESEPAFKHVFHTGGLMRSKLAPDNSRLVISLSRGYIIVIHNLDLLTLSTDLHGFKPNMYRLMQLSSEMPIHIDHLEHYNQHFHRSRNRVEFISDFPKDMDAEVIASLQIHPQGWCILSRSTSSNEQSEYTCVHDIQIDNTQSGNSELSSKKQCLQPTSSSSCAVWARNPCLRPVHFQPSTSVNGEASAIVNGLASSLVNGECDSGEVEEVSGDISSSDEALNEDDIEDSDNEDAGDVEDIEDDNSGSVQIDMAIFDELFSSTASPRNADSPATEQRNLATVRIPASQDHPERLVLNRNVQSDSEHVPGQQASGQRPETSNTEPSNSDSSRQPAVPSTVPQALEYLTFSMFRMAGANQSNPSNHRKRKSDNNYQPNYKDHILKNQSRMLCYAEEPNVGRGFIKELCFSADGRLVCSPFGYGVRLLAFNPSCDELCDCIPESPVKMYEVASSVCHSNVVVTSKFSPVHCLLVTGCLNGKASFCQPVL